MCSGRATARILIGLRVTREHGVLAGSVDAMMKFCPRHHVFPAVSLPAAARRKRTFGAAERRGRWLHGRRSAAVAERGH
jgi:hypothetical protein